MKTKLHLPALKPLNEGARRLAWFFGRGGDQAFDRFARTIGHHVSYVDRLISGEVEPVGDEANAIYWATGGAVWSRDWLRPADGAWADHPADRGMLAKAA
ncbi:hypothetical protein KCP91_08255 [Microvirga sp. SRT01]|uniref:XRE family transcriptional regulator n=1 Tax=Sphingomonas longa TaxID=2778730 RepID=A0ABS2D753_9SPHN|nr:MULTISPECIES: hypothetical protein [Alphaproteobacteria]MBM6576363.1 hypothetical protein [Sphingomonas sp. BT552]MBR7709409.1 hypothetical protein [Microvirga sp. SRT01]